MENLLRKKAGEKFDMISELTSIYFRVALFIVPLGIIFLVLEQFGQVEVFYIHRYLITYIVLLLVIISIIILFKWNKKWLTYCHYSLLFGVIAINFIWFYLEPSYEFDINFLVAINMVGFVLIQPKSTVLFYIITLLAYLIIGSINGAFNIQYFYLVLSSAIIVSMFNSWRFSLLKSLQNARKTYQEIFDSSEVQKYVLSMDNKILDLSLNAEEYLKGRGQTDIIGKSFQDIFIPETESCYLNFTEAFEKVTVKERSLFRANCALRGSDEFIPKEFTLKKSKYFGQDVIILDVRINKEQKELLDHKDNVSQILDNISSFVYNISYDISDRFKHHVNFVSPKVKDVFGYSVDEYISLIKAEKIDQDRHPDDKEVIKKRFEQLLKNGGKDTWRFRMKVFGKWHWIEEKMIVKRSDDGKTASLLGLVKNITEELSAEKLLKESEQRYRQIFETTLAGVYKTNIAGEILDCNPAFAKTLGYDNVNELLKLSAKDIYYEKADREEYIKKLKKEKELNNFITRLKHKNGNDVFVSNNVSLLPDENKENTIILGTLIDITEQYEYEQEILESRLSFKNIIDHSPASILIFTNNELKFVNPKGGHLLAEVIGSSSHSLFDIFPDTIHQLITDLKKEADNEISSYTEIELGQKKDIKRYSITVVKTVYKRRPSYLFILLDISLQKEYNIQKLRAEVAEETNKLLQEEIERHKKTQKSLVESTSRINALFQTTSNLYIISLDNDFNLMSFNDKFKTLLSDYLDKDVQIGDNFMEIFPVQDYAIARIKNRFEDVFKGHATNMISNFNSNIGVIWMESFISPIIIEGEKTKEIALIAHDITEQVMNKKRILESEENNKALLKAIPDILFKVNKKGIFTDFRPSSESHRNAFERLIKTDNIIGKKVNEVLADEKVANEIIEGVKQTLEEEQVQMHNFSIKFGKNTGSSVHYENRYAKINDDEVVIISRDITDTIEYEQKLIDSVKEKEVLLKEVHHRVKNNLQVINSILNLQSSYVTDEEMLQIIIESQNRIRSMSYIHESLYQTKDFSSINFFDYITNLVQNLVHSYDVAAEKTELELAIDQVELALDQAIPCGLILNELITNALKYAYPEGQKGKINIGVWEEEGKVFLRVQDFGVGLPKGFKIDESESLGLSLVDTLIDQIDGELILKTESGTEFLIIFEKQEI